MNWLQALVIESLMYTVALSVKVVAFVNASRHKKIAGTGNGTKNISEIKYLDLPDEVKSSYDAYSQHGWQGTYPGQAKGMRAGGNYSNIDGKLPVGVYREFDINPPIPGIGRDASRFVVDINNKIVYLTRNHYSTFFRIIK